MSGFSYEDFAFSSDEEIDEEAPNDQKTCDDTEDGSDDGSPPNVTTDWDEYADFETDQEKHDYDQSKWTGIQNTRTYQKKVQRGTTRKPKANGQVKAKRVAKAESQKKQRKRKENALTTQKPIVQTPKDREIYFDITGALWYSYLKDGIYISERATFHHWIRPALSRDENAKGTYVFARNRGPGNFDVTCFNEVQQRWGLQRPHYAPVMFEWERLYRQDPNYHIGSLYHQGLLVLDYWRSPIRDFREIPLVISSAYEGGYMEPATRLHSEIRYEDIRARMPPFIDVVEDGALNVIPLSRSNTFSGRSRRFREEAGAITWDKKREGSATIKAFIEDIVKPINNSTSGSRGLTKLELKKLRLINQGRHPERSKAETTQESKDKYIANTRRAAGLDVEGKDDYVQEMEFEDEATEVEAEEIEAEDEEMEVEIEEVGVTASPRLIFILIGRPCLGIMTEEEAHFHPTVDHWDPRNHLPKSWDEIAAIREALQLTIDHFREIIGLEPIEHEGENYISEYCNIQQQVDDLFGDDAPALRRLGPWLGRVFDWRAATVEDDPCVGRQRPPFY